MDPACSAESRKPSACGMGERRITTPSGPTTGSERTGDLMHVADDAEHVGELLGLYHLDELDAEAAAAVRAHLDSCEACRDEAAEVCDLLGALALLADERDAIVNEYGALGTSVPPAFPQRFAPVEEPEDGSGQRRGMPWPHRPRWFGRKQASDSPATTPPAVTPVTIAPATTPPLPASSASAPPSEPAKRPAGTPADPPPAANSPQNATTAATPATSSTAVALPAVEPAEPPAARTPPPAAVGRNASVGSPAVPRRAPTGQAPPTNRVAPVVKMPRSDRPAPEAAPAVPRPRLR
ncbi:zf-HC2 domain-containing protein [Verrucosispora sioxanthis]|uniref:zf-HC2 domain-containing protein n=1 Tax=Verrucosispora sioxanthis TaxID=2499994 RepID=UPI0035A1A1F3